MPNRVQDLLKKVRPPRVKITYDVETLGASKQISLPLVVGILANLTGDVDKRQELSDQRVADNLEPFPTRTEGLEERKFVGIDSATFNEVMTKIRPVIQISGLPFSVPPLVFEKLEDFEPFNVAQQVDTIRDKIALRQRLADLRASLDGNKSLTKVLNSKVLTPDTGKSDLQVEIDITRQARSASDNVDVASGMTADTLKLIKDAQKSAEVANNAATAFVNAFTADGDEKTSATTASEAVAKIVADLGSLLAAYDTPGELVKKISDASGPAIKAAEIATPNRIDASKAAIEVASTQGDLVKVESDKLLLLDSGEGSTKAAVDAMQAAYGVAPEAQTESAQAALDTALAAKTAADNAVKAADKIIAALTQSKTDIGAADTKDESDRKKN